MTVHWVGDEHDLVSGDEQTLERVKRALCEEFSLSLLENATLRDVVRAIQALKGKHVLNLAATSAAPPTARGAMLAPLLELFDTPNASEIVRVCTDLALFLLEKNKNYGDSAVNPVRVFSKADPAEQLRVRMDDKLSRLMRGSPGGEDIIKDLVGYWVLLQIVQAKGGV